MNQFRRSIPQQRVIGWNTMPFGNSSDQGHAFGIRIILNFVDGHLQDASRGKRNAQGIDAGAEIAQIRWIPGQEAGGVVHVPAVAYIPFHNVAKTMASTVANPNEIHINSIAMGT